MTTPLTPAQLHPLLDILANPDHPGFTQALDKLTSLSTEGLNAADAMALMAKLEATLTTLEKARVLTAEQLGALRSRNKALGAYNRVK